MPAKETIVVIEDEEDILEVIQYNLSREGYRVCTAEDGERGLDLVRRETPQLILLDLMLPGLDGIEVCRRLKTDAATRGIPLIMVTAKGEESDIVLGLGMGADDYVAKPFSPTEMLGRVRAVLRRGPLREEMEQEERLVRGSLVVDSRRHEVRAAGRPVPLTATEFRLLRLLASYPGQVFSRDTILSRVMGEDTFLLDRNVDVHVRSVRKKLGREADLIETVRGVGYRFREQED